MDPVGWGGSRTEAEEVLQDINNELEAYAEKFGLTLDE
jgi:hypothetical protein